MRKPALLLSAALLGLAALLAGCAGLELVQTDRRLLDSLATRNGFTAVSHAGPGGPILGYRRLDGGSPYLAVYIEGDGAPWIDRRQPADPTPEEPLSFRLALADPLPNRLYLTRPCQFLDPAALARCDPSLWGRRRHAPEVVAALNAAIDREKAASGARQVVLHGQSGGGVEAALIAARRTDVAFLLTATAYLDSARWTALQGVSPLDGSLNPADLADRLRGVPQVHLAGADDDIVPPAVPQSYAARLGRPSAVIVVPGLGHDCCGRRQWAKFLEDLRHLP